MKKFFVFIIVISAVGLVYAKPKTNGPPLYVCEGAVPLEPNVDKLEQLYFRNTKWNKPESKAVVVLSEKEFKESQGLLNTKLDPYDDSFIYVFYFNGSVPDRDGQGMIIPMLIEVFGVERAYVPNRMDHVTIHVVSKDLNPKKPMLAHSPAVFYKIKKDKLDTEHDGTPPITNKTVFEIHECRTVMKYFKR